MLASLALAGCAGLFVGSDVLEHHFFPTMPTALRHGLLTARAALVTGIGFVAVHLLMNVQQRRITATADELGRRLEAYRSDSDSRTRFLNPHRLHCRDVLACRRTDCPMYDVTDQPCWQVRALSNAAGNGDGSSVSIQKCHECAVYRRACPDGLIRLGESFNNLMFMLDEEAAQVRRMQAQMVEKEKMVAIGQMAAGTAHEIGNPLSSISSIVQVLKRKPSSNLVEKLDLIQTHIQRISSTVRQMASLARPMPAHWEVVDVAATLQDAVRLVAFDRRAKRVKIRSSVPEHLPKSFALRAQLQQVFINLLLNALDAMPDGGRLEVSARRHSQTITIDFEDNGCGIPAHVGRRVFEPFFTTKEPGKGTGMGLAVSYGIVQKHGGTIDFHCRPGGGTKFTVDLPILTQAPDQ